MTKRTFFLLMALIIVLILVLAVCSEERVTEPNDVDDAAISMADFKQIDGEESLVYSIETRCVYYMFSTCEWVGNIGYGYGYMAPYISENGKFCRYIGDEIVEIP